MSAQPPTPREIADRQLAAYNARDLDAYMALFDPAAELVDLPSGTVLASGAQAIRALYAARFATPGLECRVHARIDIADHAIDRETVYGLPGGPVEILALYRVRAGLIVWVGFIREPGHRPG
ncbi:nuclear transport factor 2 family protein [Limibaculum sp. FT325]|uniref:nuclear transport factor 2 family protein n=1 Tax=Thermohalobaculum sediminis TaxID=2939436 RepID=UPI0020BEA3DF|nr:nuclear transport factor 2 family protein [Limibaculum sediminis]MCL5775757.1 nuclear transport factor 2 family protein [Limibaculum sediminis]